MDASNLRTKAVQELARAFSAQSQTTIPADGPDRAIGEVAFSDGRVYRVEVTLIKPAAPSRDRGHESWDSVFDGNSRHRN